MSAPQNSTDITHVPFAIHLEDTLNPEAVVPNTPTSDYKQIDDDIVVGIATGFWSTDLFASFSDLVPNALMASLCPCVSLAQITNRLGVLPFKPSLLCFGILYSLEACVLALTVQQFILIVMYGSNRGELHYRYYHAHRYYDPDDGPSFNALFIVVAVLTHATFITTLWLLRKRIRDRFQIPGSNSDDCLSVACCPCFSTAQMAAHIKSYRPGSCSFGPVDTLPHYQ